MSEQAKVYIRNVYSDPAPETQIGTKKHSAMALAEKIEERLFKRNKFRRLKKVYTVDELWDLFRVLFINHFGTSEEAHLKAWTYNLKNKGCVQVLNALYDLLEKRHPSVKFERRVAKPKQEE